MGGRTSTHTVRRAGPGRLRARRDSNTQLLTVVRSLSLSYEARCEASSVDGHGQNPPGRAGPHRRGYGARRDRQRRARAAIRSPTRAGPPRHVRSAVVLNAFDRALYEAVASSLSGAAGDDSTRVVVLTGEGRAFSAGQDLGEMARIAAVASTGGATGASGGDCDPSGFSTLLDALVDFPKPLLAAVNGLGVGLGLTMWPTATGARRRRAVCACLSPSSAWPPRPPAATCCPCGWAGRRPRTYCSRRSGSTPPRPSGAGWPGRPAPPARCSMRPWPSPGRSRPSRSRRWWPPRRR